MSCKKKMFLKDHGLKTVRMRTVGQIPRHESKQASLLNSKYYFGIALQRVEKVVRMWRLLSEQVLESNLLPFF